MKQALPIFILTVALCSCGKPEPSTEYGDNFVNLSYIQTKCADPWPTGATDSITLVNMANYLESRNLYLAIRQDNLPDTCTACTCKTGKIIYITTFVLNISVALYAEIGFH